ncbi:MAG: lipopolysaccharide biosynthesis protein [Acidobacteriota bacterium]
MRRHLTNAVCGALDYASYPVGMLAVAPVVLHRLGAAEYGLWMITTSIISAGGIIASGFGDANLQRVAHLRGAGDAARIADTVRSMLGISLALGTGIAALVWTAAPWIAPHIAVAPLAPARECLVAIRIASAAILLRSLETVGVSTLRAFEEYRATVQISMATRFLTLGAAAILAFLGYRTVSILLATAAFLLLGAWMQFRQVRRLAGPVLLWPKLHREEARVLLGVGFFAWLQALGGVIFGQADRILLGVSLGAAVVAPYALCVQFAQPVFGLTASGLHFLFPYLSAQTKESSGERFRRTVVQAFVCNLLLVTIGAFLLLAVGPRLIRLWAGPAVAHSAAGILTPIVAGSALMGLGVTGTYAMQALGLFRTVACISLAGHSAMLLVMLFLLHHNGLSGLAFSRLGYGSAALIVYLPLLAKLPRKARGYATAASAPSELQEGWKL